MTSAIRPLNYYSKPPNRFLMDWMIFLPNNRELGNPLTTIKANKEMDGTKTDMINTLNVKSSRGRKFCAVANLNWRERGSQVNKEWRKRSDRGNGIQWKWEGSQLEGVMVTAKGREVTWRKGRKQWQNIFWWIISKRKRRIESTQARHRRDKCPWRCLVVRGPSCSPLPWVSPSTSLSRLLSSPTYPMASSSFLSFNPETKKKN